MKQITVLETSDYEKLTPGMLVAYLEKHGWEKVTSNERRTLWQFGADSETKILIPVKKLNDFPYIAWYVIKRISEICSKDEVDVFNEIQELGKEEVAKLIRIQRRNFIKWLVDSPDVFDKFEITLQKETVKFRYPDSNNIYLTDYFNAIDFANKSIYNQPL
jgi:hypothetical protein